MNAPPANSKNLLAEALVVLVSLTLAVILGVAAWDMNHWPSDTETYYMPAAIQLKMSLARLSVSSRVAR